MTAARADRAIDPSEAWVLSVGSRRLIASNARRIEGVRADLEEATVRRPAPSPVLMFDDAVTPPMPGGPRLRCPMRLLFVSRSHLTGYHCVVTHIDRTQLL